jgi:hypothetical protein
VCSLELEPQTVALVGQRADLAGDLLEQVHGVDRGWTLCCFARWSGRWFGRRLPDCSAMPFAASAGWPEIARRCWVSVRQMPFWRSAGPFGSLRVP